MDYPLPAQWMVILKLRHICSTDPVSGANLAITATTTNTFTVNVGASPIVNHDVAMQLTILQRV